MAVKELAEKVGVSKRTVQREMEGISYFPGYEVTLESKTGKGVWVEGTPEEKKRLLEELKGSDSYDVSNREERRKRLVLEILKDKGLKKLFYYASQFQVSEATISSDLEAVEGWLNAQHLTIVRKPGSWHRNQWFGEGLPQGNSGIYRGKSGHEDVERGL